MRPARQSQIRLWGSTKSAFDAWQAWRGVACLLVAGSTVDAWATRPWLTPPRNVAELAALAAIVAPIIASGTTRSAAHALVELAPALRDLHVRGALSDGVGDQPVLRPVLADISTILGRPSTALRARSQQISLLHPESRIEWIPTVAPIEHLPKQWAERTVPAQVLGQAAVAAASARLAGAGTWKDAAQHLGLNPVRVSKWVQYVLRHFTPDGKQQLTEAAEFNLNHFTLKQQPQPRPKHTLCSVADLNRWRDETKSAAVIDM